MLLGSTCFSTFTHLATIWQEADDDETGTIDESEQPWHRHCSLMFIWFFWFLGVNCNSNPICRPLYLSSGDGWSMLFCFFVSCFLMSASTILLWSKTIFCSSSSPCTDSARFRTFFEQPKARIQKFNLEDQTSNHYFISVWTANTCNMCNMCKTHSKHHLSAPLGVERCFGFIETIPGAYTAERAWYLCAMTLGQRCLTLKETRPQKVSVSHRE